jgi:hypothetical protein
LAPPVANLPKVSTTPAELLVKFAAVVIDSVIFKDLGEDKMIHKKNLKQKIS